MTAFSNLRNEYFGKVVEDVADSAYKGAKNAFRTILEEVPAELPPPRNQPPPPQHEEEPPPVQQVRYQQPPYQPPYQAQPYYPVPTQQNPFGAPYMPPPPAPKYKVDEGKMRDMAKWRATVNLKYVETLSSFARSMVGNMAATNAMVELVEKLDRNDSTLTPEQRAMAPTVRKAVEQRRKIEKAKAAILSDDDMRSIYEELIFQEMWDQNERGELKLESPKDFLMNYAILTGFEILHSGKEVIGDKISGVFNTAKLKISGKK